ncbi:hypothetical protein SAMN05444147_11619 [Pectobacterium carotovorum]|nr:hypothetical protein SAMN05444147_11619 [Pectobacterium carotovorum]
MIKETMRIRGKPYREMGFHKERTGIIQGSEVYVKV